MPYYQFYIDMCNMIEYQLRLTFLDHEVPPLAEEVPPCPRVRAILDMPSLPWRVVARRGWNVRDKSINMNVYCNSIFCGRVMPNNSTDCIRGLVGYTKGMHCWEIRWPPKHRGRFPIIGVATKDAPLSCDDYTAVVGTNEHSWGFDMRKNLLYHGNEKPRPYPVFRDPNVTYVIPDVVMVILDMDEGTLSFVVDGKNLGVAFANLQGKKLYPIINMVNFYGVAAMRYVGSLEPGPPSLQLLARLAIREAIGVADIIPATRRMNLPDHLKLYVSRPGLSFP